MRHKGKVIKKSPLPERKLDYPRPPLLSTETEDIILDVHKLGLTLIIRRNRFSGVEVYDVTHNGSAQRTGMIARDDLVVAVDGVSVNGMRAEEVEDVLDGPAGSTVILSMLRASEPVRIVRLVRDQEAAPKHISMPFVQNLRPVTDTDPRLEQLRRRIHTAIQPTT
mmetsp:Transcript_10354/g.16176  ORF Transcript_10354/g.16176 Transcript_10354/m.16176 type:complete len:166 (-) Transcript_10354:761-1258(-)